MPSPLNFKWLRHRQPHGPESITNFHFYYHDVVTGPNPTTAMVVPPASNSSSTTLFGSVIMVDDPLTETSDPGSKLVGRAQGMYGMAGRKEMVVQMVMSYGFTDGAYNGSSLSIVGRNPVVNRAYRELPVLGGTGVFRMARGYAELETVSPSSDRVNAVVRYNVTVYVAAYK